MTYLRGERAVQSKYITDSTNFTFFYRKHHENLMRCTFTPMWHLLYTDDLPVRIAAVLTVTRLSSDTAYQPIVPFISSVNCGRRKC